MTEREKMLYAKSFIDKLARGVDPTSDTDVIADSVLNNARIVRCLFYVSSLIDKLIMATDAEGTVRIAVKSRSAFTISQEQLQKLPVTRGQVSISVLTKTVSLSRYPDGETTLPVTWVTEWLAEKGFLRKEQKIGLRDGKTQKTATAQGEEIGITTIDAMSPNGYPIKKNLYDEFAQKFIIEHLLEILDGH